MDRTIVSECMRMSFADTPFPDVVKRLSAAGVRAYRADLIRLCKNYYGEDSENYEHPIPLADGPPVGPEFREAEVIAAVRAIQRQEIGYAAFLRRIMQAGCASYNVFFGGCKAMYFGRDGTFYTEPFPGAN